MALIWGAVAPPPLHPLLRPLLVAEAAGLDPCSVEVLEALWGVVISMVRHISNLGVEGVSVRPGVEAVAEVVLRIAAVGALILIVVVMLVLVVGRLGLVVGVAAVEEVMMSGEVAAAAGAVVGDLTPAVGAEVAVEVVEEVIVAGAVAVGDLRRAVGAVVGEDLMGVGVVGEVAKMVGGLRVN